MSLCKYRNIFGEPWKGVHSARLFGVAAFDLVATVVASVIISMLFKINVFIVFTFLLLLSLVVHYLFCVKTTLTKMIF